MLSCSEIRWSLPSSDPFLLRSGLGRGFLPRRRSVIMFSLNIHKLKALPKPLTAFLAKVGGLGKRKRGDWVVGVCSEEKEGKKQKHTHIPPPNMSPCGAIAFPGPAKGGRAEAQASTHPPLLGRISQSLGKIIMMIIIIIIVIIIIIIIINRGREGFSAP